MSNINAVKVFKTEREFAKYLRDNFDSMDCRDCSDEYLVDESHALGEWKYSEEGYILHRFQKFGGIEGDE